MSKAAADPLLERGLPANKEAEMAVLGSVLLHGPCFDQAAAMLHGDDFSIEKHRRIFLAMAECSASGEPINYVTLATQLRYRDQLESVGGASYLSELTNGLPKFEDIDSYCRLVKECSRKRHVIFAAQAAIGSALESGGTAAEIAGALFGQLAKIEVGKAHIETAGEFLKSYEGGLTGLFNSSRQGLQTGFLRFDELTTGLYPGQLIIIGARTGQGKSSMAMNIAQHAAERGKVVVFFSLEMSKEELLRRVLSTTARVDLLRARRGFLNAEERTRLIQAAGRLASWPLILDDTGAVDLHYIRSVCDRVRAKTSELDLVVIDYLQLMTSKQRSENRTQEVTAISNGLKMLAKESHVPVLALSQLRRAERKGDNRPILSDLRESGSLEQDSDVVALIYREEAYKEDREDLHGLAELILAKQRNGPCGKINLVFLHKYTSFENRYEDAPDGGGE